MVIPWSGFPLAQLLEAVEPKSEAKYVRFEALYDPEQMPGQRDRLILLVKAGRREPFLYGAVVVLLLLARLPGLGKIVLRPHRWFKR